MVTISFTAPWELKGAINNSSNPISNQFVENGTVRVVEIPFTADEEASNGFDFWFRLEEISGQVPIQELEKVRLRLVGQDQQGNPTGNNDSVVVLADAEDDGQG